jgi:hypothetical protein
MGKSPIRTMPSNALTAEALMRTSASSAPGWGSGKGRGRENFQTAV